MSAPFAPLPLLTADEIAPIRDLVARRLAELGQWPRPVPPAPDDVSMLWSLHTALAEAVMNATTVPPYDPATDGIDWLERGR